MSFPPPPRFTTAGKHLCGLLLLAPALAHTAAAAATVCTYSTAISCEGVCSTSGSQYVCNLIANGDAADADLTAVYIGGIWEVWGDDASGLPFCCNTAPQNELRVDGSLHGDTVDFNEAGYHLMNATAYVYGSGGNDVIAGSTSTTLLEYLYGDDGNDVLNGFGGNDFLYGGREDDQLFGGDGDDYLDGGYDKDQLWGGNGNDTMHGNAVNPGNINFDDDKFKGEKGDDTIFGDGGVDLICGGPGIDDLNGGATPGNLVFGGPEVDDIFGGTMGMNECEPVDGGARINCATLLLLSCPW